MINIQIRIKAVGKRKPILELVPMLIPENIATVEDLISFIVTENVRKYNLKAVDAPYFQYLSQEDYESALLLGKVGFRDRKNEAQQDELKAIENAIQCYKDGIFRIVINEKEVTEGDSFSIKEGDILTFIRLTMLAGRMF